MERGGAAAGEESLTRRYRVFGIVQGVGFRPFVSRLATAHGLSGSVANKGPYVEILAQGRRTAMADFRRALTEEAPERSAVLRVAEEALPPFSADGFAIVESASERGAVFVSPDIAVCEKCRRELFDPADRRYLHPFINCTACGPRLTILDAMPYDRENTSMKAFPMCRRCAAEYDDPASRRYDAQPVCCPDCGPQVYLLDSEARGGAAITEARRRIAAGGIVAVKGIGGFHLCCDALSAAAVARLRRDKRRPFKPFAVMARNLAVAAREAEVSDEAGEILDGPQKPILLLARRPGGRIAADVAPGLNRVGIMLPYTPLHLLLFDYPDDVTMPDALVMTSGNPPGAPLCRTEGDARALLAPLADAILSHDRRIRVRADDSVMDWAEGGPYMVRRSRGYAPLPVMLSAGLRGEVLALGGELKNTFCLGKDDLFYPSAYVGELSDVRTLAALRESVDRMASLLEIAPQVVACDLHPRYRTTALAKELGRPVRAVQHHYAHIVSCLAENDAAGPVIGVAFDGTGYGTDGTVWGGEFLWADYGGFTRLGSLEPFPLAGGDRAAEEGWRAAVNLLGVIDPARAKEEALALGLGTEGEITVQCLMAEKHLNCVTTTSAGRLFDAVSALLGIRRVSTFEGEAAMYLEAAAENFGVSTALPPPLLFEAAGFFRLPTRAIFQRLAAARRKGEDPARLAAEFHAMLAASIVAGCRAAREATGLFTAALSGGVFQNRLLLRLVTEGLAADGFTVLRHHLIPPNDGGLALGQAVHALGKFMSEA
mgnify:FL=1